MFERRADPLRAQVDEECTYRKNEGVLNPHRNLSPVSNTSTCLWLRPARFHARSKGTLSAAHCKSRWGKGDGVASLQRLRDLARHSMTREELLCDARIRARLRSRWSRPCRRCGGAATRMPVRAGCRCCTTVSRRSWRAGGDGGQSTRACSCARTTPRSLCRSHSDTRVLPPSVTPTRPHGDDLEDENLRASGGLASRSAGPGRLWRSSGNNCRSRYRRRSSSRPSWTSSRSSTEGSRDSELSLGLMTRRGGTRSHEVRRVLVRDVWRGCIAGSEQTRGQAAATAVARRELKPGPRGERTYVRRLKLPLPSSRSCSRSCCLAASLTPADCSPSCPTTSSHNPAKSAARRPRTAARAATRRASTSSSARQSTRSSCVYSHSLVKKARRADLRALAGLAGAQVRLRARQGSPFRRSAAQRGRASRVAPSSR